MARTFVNSNDFCAMVSTKWLQSNQTRSPFSQDRSGMRDYKKNWAATMIRVLMTWEMLL